MWLVVPFYRNAIVFQRRVWRVFSGGLFWCQEKRIIKECPPLGGLELLSSPHTQGVFIATEQLSSDAVENTGLGF